MHQVNPKYCHRLLTSLLSMKAETSTTKTVLYYNTFIPEKCLPAELVRIVRHKLEQQSLLKFSFLFLLCYSYAWLVNHLDQLNNQIGLSELEPWQSNAMDYWVSNAYCFPPPAFCQIYEVPHSPPWRISVLVSTWVKRNHSYNESNAQQSSQELI